MSIPCCELSLALAEMGRTRLATAGQLEVLFQHMERTLLGASFLRKANPLRVMFPPRRLFYRAGLDQRETRIQRGMLRGFDYHVHRQRRM